MKFLTIFLSLSLASVALAQEPAELVNLRKIWKNTQANAKKTAESVYETKNLEANKFYYEELQQMKDNFMEAKNLKAAVAVDAELEKLKALHGKQKFEAPKEEKPSSDNTKAILEGIVGEYRAQVPNPNDWLVGSITIEQRNKQGFPVVLRWANMAGKSWLLFPDLDERVMRTSQDYAYYNEKSARNWEMLFDSNGDKLIGFNAWRGNKFIKTR